MFTIKKGNSAIKNGISNSLSQFCLKILFVYFAKKLVTRSHFLFENKITIHTFNSFVQHYFDLFTKVIKYFCQLEEEQRRP